MSLVENEELRFKRKKISFGRIEFINFVADYYSEEDDESKSGHGTPKRGIFNASENVYRSSNTPRQTAAAMGQHADWDTPESNFLCKPKQRRSGYDSPKLSFFNDENESSGASATSSPVIKRKNFKDPLRVIDQNSADKKMTFNNNKGSPLFISSNNLTSDRRLSLSKKGTTPTLNDSIEENFTKKFERRRGSKTQFHNPVSAPSAIELFRARISFINSSSAEIPSHCHQSRVHRPSEPQLYKSSDFIDGPSKADHKDLNFDSMDIEMTDDSDEIARIFDFGQTTTASAVHQNENGNRHQLLHERAETALARDSQCRNLIGDRSTEHILPVVNNPKHTDLFTITPDTLVDVLEGKYNSQIDEYIIVDSRYPYEFQGGHIANALNIYTKKNLFIEMFINRFNLHSLCHNHGVNHHHKLPTSLSSSDLLNHHHSYHNALSRHQPLSRSNSRSTTVSLNKIDAQAAYKKRTIIIFHCEFSSERGPSMMKFLRNQDRSLNEHAYPNLFYPELYLLEGGYKAFFEKYKNYCEPQTYKPMSHVDHANDYKLFKAKAQSWEVSLNSYLENHFGPSMDNWSLKGHAVPELP